MFSLKVYLNISLLSVLLTGISPGQSSHEESVLDRFLRYAKINTESKEGVDTVPSTAHQFNLARILVKELQEMGISDARLDDHCFVYGTIPCNLTGEDCGKVPSIGFISHLDTSPEVSGDHVNPIVHHNYQGNDISLPGDSAQVITTGANPRLRDNTGSDIITADGTTLLGADDKAGIAEIMTAIQTLAHDTTIHHGTVRVAFTPDEETGTGVAKFDLKGFGAQYAYTVDGGFAGEISNETWNADEALLTFRGHNTHPGNAKGKMVNSLYILSDFISRLPENMRPEATDKREGFLHPYSGTMTAEQSDLRILLRSFDTSGLTKERRILMDIRKGTLEKFPSGKIDIVFQESYRNMKLKLDRVPFVTEYALEACRGAGLQPKLVPTRGGTDGSDLTAMGLPCPNLFTGGENFHSKLEWIPVRGMEKAVQTIVNLIKIWKQESLPPK